MVAVGYQDSKIGVIPIEWEAIELGDIATFSKGKGISKKDISEDGVECIRYGELFTTYNEIITTIKSKTNSTTNMMYSKVNDTLMPTSDVTPTGLATASALNKKGVILGGDILIIRSNDILNSYLSYFIKSHKKQIMKLVSGSTVYHIYANDMKKLKIPLPPLKEQEKIADILSTADNKIDAIATQIEKAEKLKKGLLQKLLSEGMGHTEFKDSELGKIPESWEIVRVENISKVIRGASPRPKGDPRYYGGNIPRLMGTDVTRDGKYVIPNKDFLTEAGAKRSRFLPKGTLTIVCSGTVGVPSILGVDCCIHDGFLALIDIKENIELDFLFHLFSSLQEKFDNSATHGGVFTNLTTSIIKEFLIQLPPLEEQKQIADILSTADEKLEVLRAKKDKYETLKKGLLQKLLSGEVRV